MSNIYKVLVADDEDDIVDFLKYNLQKNDYIVFTASNGLDALSIVEKEKPHLVLLDIMMPVLDGIETCHMIRQMQGIDQPLIAFLSAVSEEFSQIEGLKIGADDYILKPIKPRLLLSKVASLLRRYQVDQRWELSATDSELELDSLAYEIIQQGDRIQLPKKEFQLLEYLYKSSHRVVNRDEILENVWGKEIVVGERTIDVHVKKLRQRIGNDYIRTVKGVGYQFKMTNE